MAETAFAKARSASPIAAATPPTSTSPKVPRLDQVVQKINGATGISVQATFGSEGLILTDKTGLGSNNFSVQDLNGGFAAQDLGIAQNVAANAITGSDINFIKDTTSLSILNNGTGVRTAGGSPDFRVTVGDGSSVDVSVSSAKTIGDVVAALNTAGAGKFTASLADPKGSAIQLTDTSGGGGSFTVAALNNSQAAHDLGIEQTGSAGSMTGGDLLPALNTVQTAGVLTIELGGGDLTSQTDLASLNGGDGVRRGLFRITDRSGASSVIDISSAVTLDDVIKKINTSLDISVRALDPGQLSGPDRPDRQDRQQSDCPGCGRRAFGPGFGHRQRCRRQHAHRQRHQSPGHRHGLGRTQ